MTENLTPCAMKLREEWEKCDHLARFETWASLYYARFRRLSPGKSEPMGFGNSDDSENRAQRDDWHKSGLAKQDAVMALARAWSRIEELERQRDDAVDAAREAVAAADSHVSAVESCSKWLHDSTLWAGDDYTNGLLNDAEERIDKARTRLTEVTRD